jgi:hypothetical protein
MLPQALGVPFPASIALIAIEPEHNQPGIRVNLGPGPDLRRWRRSGDQDARERLAVTGTAARTAVRMAWRRTSAWQTAT